MGPESGRSYFSELILRKDAFLNGVRKDAFLNGVLIPLFIESKCIHGEGGEAFCKIAVPKVFRQLIT